MDIEIENLTNIAVIVRQRTYLRTSAYGPAQAQPPRACIPNKSFSSADIKL